MTSPTMTGVESTPIAPTAKLPPGPSTPGCRQSWRDLHDSWSLFDDCARKYGDIFTLRLGSHGTRVFISSPEMVKELYTADPETYRAGAAKARVFGPVVGYTSSLVLDGEAHLKRRRLLLPTFHGDQMLAHTEVIYRFHRRGARSLAGPPGRFRCILSCSVLR